MVGVCIGEEGCGGGGGGCRMRFGVAGRRGE